MRDFLKEPLSNAAGLLAAVLVCLALIFSGGSVGNLTALSLPTGGNSNINGTLVVSNGLTVTAGTISLPTGEVAAGEIADISRNINLPLNSFIECKTDAGALIGFDTTADTLPDFVNSATDGLGFVIRFDATGGTEDQSTPICNNFVVPPDYVSGGAFVIQALKTGHTAATEVINCAVSVDGAALQAAGTVTTTAAASTAYTCTPTIAALVATDSVSVSLSITSGTTMNDGVDFAAVAFQYTASQ